MWKMIRPQKNSSHVWPSLDDWFGILTHQRYQKQKWRGSWDHQSAEKVGNLKPTISQGQGGRQKTREGYSLRQSFKHSTIYQEGWILEIHDSRDYRGDCDAELRNLCMVLALSNEQALQRLVFGSWSTWRARSGNSLSPSKGSQFILLTWMNCRGFTIPFEVIKIQKLGRRDGERSIRMEGCYSAINHEDLIYPSKCQNQLRNQH
jgi:hypothetical protein